MALALNAKIGVYNVDIPLGNCINRTLRQTNPASYAVFSNLKRQWISPPSRNFDL